MFRVDIKLETATGTVKTHKIRGTEAGVQQVKDSLRAKAPAGSTLTFKVKSI